VKTIKDAQWSKVPEDYAAAKKQRDELEEEANRAGRALKSLSGGGSMGKTPDSVRATPAWKKAKCESDAAFKELQDFNECYVKRFKQEIQQDRKWRL
jgi:acetyl/propionyl-CoA carboxylase alpha subunit